MLLYSSQTPSTDCQDINTLRYLIYQRQLADSKKKSKVQSCSLPPTLSATNEHSLRSYHQVQAWKGVDLDATGLGWKVVDECFVPVFSTLPPVPEFLLTKPKCECKGKCDTQRCSLLV